MLELSFPYEKNVQYIIENNSFIALVAGAFPFSFISGVAVKTIQLKMIYELTQVYGVKFSESLVRSILLVIAAGIATSGIVGVFGLLVPRHTPLGLFTNLSALAIGAAAETYAVGYIMKLHFDEGGSLEDFNLDKSKRKLSELYEEGKKKASEKVFKKNKRSQKNEDSTQEDG